MRLSVEDSAAKYAGGGMYAARAPTLYNTTMTGCTAGTLGGSIHSAGHVGVVTLHTVTIKVGRSHSHVPKP
jgi:hypothetical protein